jgi:antitoxin YefM
MNLIFIRFHALSYVLEGFAFLTFPICHFLWPIESCKSKQKNLNLYNKKCKSRGGSMRVINFSEARSRLKGVIDQVISDADYTVISRRDAPDAVLMSLDTFNGLMETVHLLKSPANAAHLARSVEQYRSGQVQHRDLVDAE